MKKILIVEDDSSLAYGIQIAIKGANYVPTVAKDIQTAKKVLAKDIYHMAILDVMLPDGSGYDLLKSIRSENDMPVIFLSALADEINIVTGLNIGADDYITKPFKVGELISRINAVFRRFKKQTYNQITSNQVKINIDKFALYKNNVEMKLSATEFKIVRCLMENPHNILTKDSLINLVWDIDSNFVDENTLAVNIRRIRTKIEDDPASPEYIKTIRGVGYVWNMECEKQ